MPVLGALLLSLALVQAGDGLGLELPKGWKRQEDPQKRFVQYIPPNLPAGVDCTVIIYAPMDYAGTSAELLDNMAGNMTRGKRQLGDVQKLDIGIFKVAIINQVGAFNTNEFLALHATKFGTRAQSILFACNDSDFFKARGPEVLEMLNKAVVPGGAAAAAPAPPAGGVAQVAGLNLPLPPGWTLQKDPGSGWTELVPPPGAFSGQPRVWVLPSIKIQGSHWEAHRGLLEELEKGLKWTGSYREWSGPAAGPFIKTKSNSTSDARILRLFTAAAGGQMEAIVFAPEGREEIQTALQPSFEKATLRNAPAEPPKRPEVLEAYRRVDMKKFINIDGSTFYGKIAYERILLLSNGVADLNSRHNEGFDGVPDLWKMDPGCQNGFYGKWTAEGKTVRLKRDAKQAEQVMERENGTLRFGDQVWNPMPRVDGLKLQGRYSYKSKPGAGFQFNYWAEFGEDGTFRTGGLPSWLAVSDFSGRPKPPEHCSGTYEIRNWTLWFKVGGKPVWSADFMTIGEDLKDLKIVLIDTYGFQRE